MSSYHAAWRREPANQPAEWSPEYQIAQQLPAITALNQVLHLLSQRDQSFANSLIGQAAHSPLSTREKGQLWWVKELTRRGQEIQASRAPAQATVATAAPFAPQPQASAPQERAVAFSNLAALFAKAGKHAVIVLRTQAGADFRLSVAGERSQNPGHINVTDTSRSFENRVWFGRITPVGGWVASRRVDGAQLKAVEAALAEFEADPAKAAAEYGHATGSCCFCSRELTDERSVTVGYGPVCAERYGLPWGEVPGKLSCEEVRAEQQAIVKDADIPF